MNLQRPRIHEETCNRYLEEIWQLDFLAKAEILGVNKDKNSLFIPLYNKIYRFDQNGITAGEGEGEVLAPAVQVMICKYILTCPSVLPDINDSLVTYREFKDAGPLVFYFTTNTNKTLESTFCGNLTKLRERGQEIGGKVIASNIYDLSLEFHAFPCVPVILDFNDQDDLLPATCSILYRSSAANFLDMECLAMTGTLLTGKLITN